MQHFVLIACILAMVIPSISKANPTTDAIGDWRKTCFNGACHLEQVVFDQISKKIQLKASIIAKKQRLFLLLVTPLGLDLVYGIRVRVDGGKPTIGKFNTCTVQGCFVAIPFEGRILKAWKQGAKAKIFYQDGAARSVVSEISLKGVTAGLQTLRR